jgi:hypothetical protein
MKKFSALFLPPSILCLTAFTASATLQSPVALGSAASFVILAGTTVTVTGGGSIMGNIGIFPGNTFVPGTPPVTVNGTVYAGGPVAAQAQADLTIAFNDAAGRQTPVIVSGNIGGQTLLPGLYKSTSSLAISSGDLILDGGGDLNAVFIFQIASSFTMTSGRQVFLTGGANAANIFWQVGSSATLGTTAVLHGSILASVSISILTGARLDGRALAESGAVTIDTGGTAGVGLSLQFVPVTACRVSDTRGPNGPFGGPFLAATSTRAVPVSSSLCGIPSNAAAYALNVTVVPRTRFLGYLTLWPAGQPQPSVSTLNSQDGSILANAAIVPAGVGGSINAYATDDTDLVIDINGYFVPPAAGTLQFYPLTPCRILDTRIGNGTFGGPAIPGGGSRSFPVRSTCGIPATAAVYSLNVTVVPHGFLGYVTAWPTGQVQPIVSTLNSLDGTVLSNAAIVAAGTNGAVSFFANNTTDLILDINGYFAAPGLGGLNYFTVAPCRVIDTRNANGASGGPIMDGNTARAFPLPASACGLPDTASAYSLNVTVQPVGPLGYLTIWPTILAQPLVSTLNAPKGLVVANAALVAAGASGSVEVFVSNTSHVIIDTNGYFGQ